MRMPGRAAGRVTPLAALVALVGLVEPAGCTTSNEATMKVTSVFPDSAFNDAPFSVTVRGMNFRPAYRVDTASGGGSVDPDAYSAFLIPIPSDPEKGLVTVPSTKVTWTSTGLKVELPPHIVVAVYDLAVRSPRGDVATMPRAFRSLGSDSVSPRVEIDDPAPDSVVGSGSRVSVSVSADDGQGVLASLHLEVTGPDGTFFSHDCFVPLDTQRTNCPVTIDTPEAVSELDMLRVEATAFDNNGNRGEASIHLGLAPRPEVTGFSPMIGAAGGGTLITVTGRNFVPARPGDTGTLVLIDGRRLEDLVVTPTEITGVTFPHDEGVGTLAVRTGTSGKAAGEFTFVPRPIVRLIVPSEGPEDGDQPVTILGNGFREETLISFGTRYVNKQRFVGPNRIEGILPPGMGTVGVTAFDRIGGQSVTPLQFQYLAPDDPGGGPP